MSTALISKSTNHFFKPPFRKLNKNLLHYQLCGKTTLHEQKQSCDWYQILYLSCPFTIECWMKDHSSTNKNTNPQQTNSAVYKLVTVITKYATCP